MAVNGLKLKEKLLRRFLMNNQDSIKELVGIINYALEDNTDAPVSIHDLAWQLVELTRPEEIPNE